MKYNVGDRVRIVSSRDCSEYFNQRGEMDKYLNKIMTIEKVFLNGYYKMKEDGYYKMKEDGSQWNWFENMIEGPEEEWQPKMFEIVDVRDSGEGLWKERIYLFEKEGKHWCMVAGQEKNLNENRYIGIICWDEIKKPEDKKRERKLMLTDSEWEKFKKDNNL